MCWRPGLGARVSGERRLAYCPAGEIASVAFPERRVSSDPASEGSCKNAATALNETAAIAINAHLKFSSARTSVPGLNRANGRDTEAQGQLLGHRSKTDGRAHFGGIDFGIGNRVEAGEFERPHEAAGEKQTHDDHNRRRGGKETLAAEESCAQH